MPRRPSWIRLFCVVSVPLCGLVPLGIYWQVAGGAPAVTPQQARHILEKSDADTVVVDVRSPSEYAANHLDGAVNWPHSDIMRVESADSVPGHLRGKRMLLVCNSGILSGMAAKRLRALSVDGVTNISGGMQAWVASVKESSGLALCRLRNVSGQISDLPRRELTGFQQWTAVIAAFIIKPLYMLFSLFLIALLWRQTSTHLSALRWGLIFFLAGEVVCALNYFVYGEMSHLFEYLHSYGMVVCFSFTIFAFFEALDQRLIRYSDPNQRCAAISLCRGCVKYTDVPCRLKRLFLLGIPALLLAAPMAFCAAPVPVSYNVTILGTPYNYTHAVVHQLYEIRYCPMLAMLLLAASFAVLAFKKNHPVEVSKVLFAAALGPLGFSLFRALLLAAYRDNMVWFVFWEEATELLFVVFAGTVLWLFWHREPPETREMPAREGSTVATC